MILCIIYLQPTMSPTYQMLPNLRKQKTYKKNQNNKNKQKLIDIESKLQESYNREREENKINATAKIKTNPKYFYLYAKRFSKTKPKVGPFKRSDKQQSHIRLSWQIFFKTNTDLCLPHRKQTTVFYHYQSEVHSLLEDFGFSKEDFIEEINIISSNSAVEPDGLPAIFLKNCKASLLKPLKFIWKNNFDKGFTSKILKTSHISRNFRKGDQGASENYRPVPLTSLATKCFEDIKKEIANASRRKSAIYSQHGFRTGRSCLSQLLAHTERLFFHMEIGENVDRIFLQDSDGKRT